MFEPKGPKPIKGYEAWLDEYQTAGVWDRPVRTFHTDTPFYPWMPKHPNQFRVTFKLGFQ